MADAGQERGLLTPTSLVLSCKQLSSASKLGREKKSQQPLCLAWLSSAAMVPAGTAGGGMGWDRMGTTRSAPGPAEMLWAGCPDSRGGWPFFLSGLQVSVQVSRMAARRSRAVFFLW